MTTQDIIKSKKFKIAALIVGALIFVLIVFAGGVAVGLHKARFSYRWGENYEKNFVGPRGDQGGLMGPMMRGFEGRDFRNAHGLAGTIISIADNNLVVKDKDGKENTVAVSDATIIVRQRENLKITDLKASDQIVVIGNPDDNGVINANLIRVFNNNPSN